MKIYAQEIADGLEEKLKATASIAYVTKAEPFADALKIMDNFNTSIEEINKKSKLESLLKTSASETDPDLFYNKSILVSSVWNKNDDIFDKSEMWAARRTPEDKPDNINHDEKLIVGHMTGVWAIDDSGNAIASDTKVEDLPDLYHLVTSSVIYTSWSDKEYREMVAQLIEDIKAGEMFVSMECLFNGFDYGVKASDGTFHIIARNDESSFLTKHLRAYGGTGEHEGYKVGRIVRNPIFSGKGYVKKPANPASVILAGETINFSAASVINPFNKVPGVSINSTQVSASTIKENNDMSEVVNKHLEDQIAELKAAVAKVSSEKDAAVEALANANVAKTEAKLVEANLKATASEKVADETKVALEAATTKAAELEAQVKAATEAKAAVDAELATLKAGAVKSSRAAILVAGGLTVEEAEANVAKFENLNDEQYAVVAELAIQAKKFVPFGKEEDKKEDKKAADKKGKAGEDADVDALETVEADKKDAALAAADDKKGEDDKTQTIRASLIDYMRSNVVLAKKK